MKKQGRGLNRVNKKIKCCEGAKWHRFGTFVRPSSGKKVRRYRCSACGRTVSDAQFSVHYRKRYRNIDGQIFKLAASSTSIRRMATLLGIHRQTISRHIDSIGPRCKKKIQRLVEKYPNIPGVSGVPTIQMDEMHTFEHTKLKPLSVPVVVCETTRLILAFDVGKMPATGKLAKKARDKYKNRPNTRKATLQQMVKQLSLTVPPRVHIHTDKCKYYKRVIRRHFPQATLRQTKGLRPCVVGQGELKASRWDPLFSINHTLACLRDNVKHLARRTWCTIKRPDRLESLLAIAAHFHNKKILEKIAI